MMLAVNKNKKVFKMYFKVFAITSLFSFLVSASFATDISANKLHHYFYEGTRPVSQVVVSNNKEGKSFFVDVEVLEIVGVDSDTKKVSFEDGSSDFMVAPKSFLLGDGASKNVRIVYTGEFSDSAEKRYRLNFKPRIKQSYANDENAVGVVAGAQVIVSTGIVSVITPNKPVVDVLLKRIDGGVVLKNTGNVSVDLRPRRELCVNGNCITIRKKALEPGEVWLFELPDGFGFDWFYDVYGVTARVPLVVPAQ